MKFNRKLFIKVDGKKYFLRYKLDVKKYLYKITQNRAIRTR